MFTWAHRMHRGAANIGNVVTSCGHSSAPYPTRMEKVKFGVSLDQVCKQNNIPGPLLILILKLNKEAPYKKDVFRAPGHQGNMKKLVHFLQQGRLVNIDNFSVYTIASVLKKFLRKLPGGIFGADVEEELFNIINLENTEEKRETIHRLITSLPVVAQHLLVLLFGTFRSISVISDRAQTGMSSEAIGVSVAPSFFQSCVSDGKMARMEDVVRFKVATRIMKFLIDNFGVSNLFGRDNYEYYARISGRVLKVEEDWIFAFRFPPETLVSRKASLEAERTWLQQEAERWGLRFNLEAISGQEDCQSTPALVHAHEEPMDDGNHPASGGSLNNIADYSRLSVSLEENGFYAKHASASSRFLEMSLEELKAVNRYAESTKSLSFLPLVHERQAARMRTRSEWFLNPSPCPSPTPLHGAVIPEDSLSSKTSRSKRSSSGSSIVSAGTPSHVRRTSSKGEKRPLRRSSSKGHRDKENGNTSPTCRGQGSDAVQRISECDCTEVDVQTFHITLTYKPRI